ncbi:MAG: glutamine synthetase [Desulfobacterales bacterium]|nr:glutamine synthetase [Desulfobacterales bacterium]
MAEVDSMIRKQSIEPITENRHMNPQTVELRSPDGSANVHQLLAGMTIAALHGLQPRRSRNGKPSLYQHGCKQSEEIEATPGFMLGIGGLPIGGPCLL